MPNVPAAPPAGATPGPRLLLALALLGLTARVLLAAVTCGTNDAATFCRFGDEITRGGLFAAYRADSELNHPPLPALWAALAYRVTGSHPHAVDPDEPALRNGTTTWQLAPYEPPPLAFCFVLKLPSILAEGATVWLLWKLLRPRAGLNGALAIAAAYAWSLDAILVSGYHCNTDPVYAFLILLCLYLMQDARHRARFLLAGLALGAAVNVKLTPLILLPPLLLTCRRWADAGWFAAGVALCALPFLPVALGPPDLREHFRANALAYKSSMSRWGVLFLLLPKRDAIVRLTPLEWWTTRAALAYYESGRYFVLALLAGWAVLARWLGRWDRYEVAAVTLALFLVFAPGFGVQYTVMVLPLLFVVRPGPANAYGVLAGLFLLCIYFYFWTGSFPPYSRYNNEFPMLASWVGAAAWGALVYVLAALLLRRRRPHPHPAPSAEPKGTHRLGAGGAGSTNPPGSPGSAARVNP